MFRHAILLITFLQATKITWVETAKQPLQLSDSFLPVAMQVIAHLTDQMSFDKDEPITKPSMKPPIKPMTRPPSKPSTQPPYVPSQPSAGSTQAGGWWQTKPPGGWWQSTHINDNQPETISGLGQASGYLEPFSSSINSEQPSSSNSSEILSTTDNSEEISSSSSVPTSSSSIDLSSSNNIELPSPSNNLELPSSSINLGLLPPLSIFGPASFSDNLWNAPLSSFWQSIPSGGWWFGFTQRPAATTAFHKPGIFAPLAPPKPNDRLHHGFLLPVAAHSPYTVIHPPQPQAEEEPLLGPQHEEVQPLVEPLPQRTHLLPPHFQTETEELSRSEETDLDEENLQFLSPNIREMIKMSRDPDDDRVVDVWQDTRGGNNKEINKAKLSHANLRLLLLYDLLSRDAKKQRLSDFTGFSNSVMRELVESSGGGAREQLKFALKKMLDRRDCTHDYANNRAREIIDELTRGDNLFSNEIRYLQPLVYTN